MENKDKSEQIHVFAAEKLSAIFARLRILTIAEVVTIIQCIDGKKGKENGKKRKISDTVKKLSGQIIEGGKTYPNFDDYGNR